MKRPTAQVKQSIISLQKLYVMPPLKGSFRELKVGTFFEKRKKRKEEGYDNNNDCGMVQKSWI